MNLLANEGMETRIAAAGKQSNIDDESNNIKVKEKGIRQKKPWNDMEAPTSYGAKKARIKKKNSKKEAE